MFNSQTTGRCPIMKHQNNAASIKSREDSWDALTEVLQERSQQMLATTVETELEELQLLEELCDITKLLQ